MFKRVASRISVERTFKAAPQKAWDLLTDTGKWPLWGPSVREVACSERFIQKGSHGHVATPVGLRLPFLITEYVHGDFWAWKVAGIPATGHRVIPLGPRACKIVFEMPVYWLPYGIVCGIALKRMARILGETGDSGALID